MNAFRSNRFVAVLACSAILLGSASAWGAGKPTDRSNDPPKFHPPTKGSIEARLAGSDSPTPDSKPRMASGGSQAGSIGDGGVAGAGDVCNGCSNTVACGDGGCVAAQGASGVCHCYSPRGCGEVLACPNGDSDCPAGEFCLTNTSCDPPATCGIPCDGNVACECPGGSCANTNATDCTQLGGTPQGAGTACGVATGACCYDGAAPACVVTSEAFCTAILQGDYLGDNTQCVDIEFVDLYFPGSAIPTVGIVEDTQNVAESLIIQDVNVDLRVTHTWVGDLVVTLEHGGTTVTLIENMGTAVFGGIGCDADNFDIVLDDDGGGGAIEDQCVDNLASPPRYTPNNPLSAFNGMDASGPWTLTINDNVGLDAGTFDRWSLRILSVECPGACCGAVGASECAVISQAACEESQGEFLGQGVACSGPTITCPADITIECDQSNGPEVTGFPTGEDDCDDELTFDISESSIVLGDCPQEYVITRTWRATDGDGNEARCDQTITAQDTTDPVIQCQHELVVEVCAGPNGVPANQVEIGARANDNCSGEPTSNCCSGPGPGCDDATCQDAVCGLDAFCCNTAWDNICVSEASILCRDLCTGGPIEVTDDRPEVFPPTCDENGTLVTFTATDDCGNTSTCETRVRVIGGMCCPTVTDTDLKLMVTDLDLRQDTNGPVTTKARFDIWNSNEVRFSGTEKCITCWNETLISEYVAISNHFLVENLQTDKGKARIQNEGSDVCPDSEDSPLLGVAIKEHTFLGSPHVEMRSAITLPGEGEQAATILYDIIGEPEEANTGRTGGLTISQVPSSGTRPTGPQMDDGTTVLGGGVVADNRASTMFKGSLIAFPVIEVKWDRHGQLIQDTFIQILNDNPGEVKVQFYQVNGDSPLDAVIDLNTNEIIERAHPGWNWSDYQITLTGDESCYFSVATGQPKGVSPIAVLDPGNPNGRPDLDPSNPGGRLIRGFLAAWAVNDDQHEIRWNHLKGHATLVRYDHGTAFDYNPWNFRVVSGVPEGAESDATAGQLKLDGIEYDLAPETLIFDFYAAGATALTNPNVEIGD